MTLLDNARTLRRTMTDAEQKLWYYLRAHRFMGRKFKRQKPVGRYIVDFICLEEKFCRVDKRSASTNLFMKKDTT